jgi:hypothetical protein
VGTSAVGYINWSTFNIWFRCYTNCAQTQLQKLKPTRWTDSSARTTPHFNSLYSIISEYSGLFLKFHINKMTWKQYEPNFIGYHASRPMWLHKNTDCTEKDCKAVALEEASASLTFSVSIVRMLGVAKQHGGLNIQQEIIFNIRCGNHYTFLRKPSFHASDLGDNYECPSVCWCRHVHATRLKIRLLC